MPGHRSADSLPELLAFIGVIRGRTDWKFYGLRLTTLGLGLFISMCALTF
jgi:hypothetical protein